MKKKIVSLLSVTLLLCVVNVSAQEATPIKPLATCISKYIQSVKKNPAYQKDRAYFRAYCQKRDSLCENLLNKNIRVEIKQGLGYSLVKKDGIAGKGLKWLGDIEIPINVDLKVTDAELALKNSNLDVIFYDSEGTIVYATILEKEKSLTAHTDDDYITVATDEEIENFSNPYKNGDILHKGFSVLMNPFIAYKFVNVTKVVIAKSDFNLKSRVRKANDTVIQNSRKTFKGYL